VTFDRERRLREAGLIEAHPPFGAGGALLIATRRGLAACRRPELRPQRLSPYTERHSIVVAHVAARLELVGHQLLSEREIAAAERLEGRRIYSAARRDRGYHRPDLIRFGAGPEAIEVELTNKAPRRLDELLRCWRFARMRGSEIERVIYLCPPRTLLFVERALARVRIDSELIVAQPLRLPEIQLHRPTCDSSGGPGEAVKGRRPDPRRGLTDSPPPLASRVGRGRKKPQHAG
jgi:hypothetical protein